MYSGTPLDIKKNIALLHTLSAYNSLLVRYKIYSSDPRECLCTQADGIVRLMKTLVLIQHHIERILSKIKLVSPHYQEKITLI